MKNLFLLLSILFWTSFSAYAAEVTHTAVVLVDMQDSFLLESSSYASKAKSELFNETLELLSWARREAVPVLQFEFKGFGATTEKLQTYLNQMNEVKKILKDNNNGFTGVSENESVETLRKWGVNKIILGGVNGSYCIRDTATGALQNHFSVWTSSTLTANFTSPIEYPVKNWWIKSDPHFHGYDTLDSLLSTIVLEEH